MTLDLLFRLVLPLRLDLLGGAAHPPLCEDWELAVVGAPTIQAPRMLAHLLRNACTSRPFTVVQEMKDYTTMEPILAPYRQVLMVTMKAAG